MYYAWDLGYAHFIALNSETAIDVANFEKDEIAWVRSNLESVDRNNTPWIIVHFHRPMYCSVDSECASPATRLKGEMEDIFKQFGVDLVLTGHVHAYERTYPVYNDSLTESGSSYLSPTAPIYIMQGR